MIAPEPLEAIRQEHESFLTQLEALAVEAIVSNDWSDVYDHINFSAPQLEASTKSLSGSGADSLLNNPQTNH
jgi:hypothetical protein